MKIVTIVGARPQFIKAAAVSRVLRNAHTEILLHTGQHYDENMSKIFFEELELPYPDYHLGVGSGSHGKQTAAMLVKIEEILQQERPDAVLIYGDTNSTLAGALAASKLCIPIAHVEAGIRTFCRDMPEEQNRIVADHLSTWNFAPSQQAAEYLQQEGIREQVYIIGDVMYDALLYYGQKAQAHGDAWYKACLHPIIPNHADLGDQWYLATIHRPENVDQPEILKSILEGLNKLPHPVLFPVHPRIQTAVKSFAAKKTYRNLVFVEPLGYINMLYFLKNALKIITDSGGLHKESFLCGVPGVVLLRNSPWEETLAGNCNVLCKPNCIDILEKVLHTEIDKRCFQNKPYGDGHAADKLTSLLANL